MAATELIFFAATAAMSFSHHSSLGKSIDQLCPAVDENSETCVCRTSQGIIDLTALANRDGTARFRNIDDVQHFVYDFNPCQAFTSRGNCINVHVCQSANFDLSLHYPIADQGTEEIWINENNGPYLYYTGAGSREVKIFLHCDRSLADGEEQITTIGDSQIKLIYIFHLHSCHACPGGCGYGYYSSAAGPVGFFLIFLIFLSFMMYLVIGAILKKFYLGLHGMDIIPNINFWTDLPYLVQDGCWYTFGGCTRLFQQMLWVQEEVPERRHSYETDTL